MEVTPRSLDKKPNDNIIVADSHKNQPYTIIDEEGLNDVLAGREPKPYRKNIKNFTFKY